MNLASIQRITKLSPIEGADKIETATVLGWEVVVKKGQFKVGSLCIYIQIDTVVPDIKTFEFLRERKFRLRTIKLLQQISQGLIIPLEDFPTTQGMKEGSDVTDIVGVKKYEKPDNNPQDNKPRIPKKWYKKWIYLFKYNILFKLFPKLRRLSRSPFPKNLVPITDEERIQNMPQVLEQFKGQEFIASYKLDGSSITIIHHKVLGISKFRICSRRFELHNKNNDWYKVFENTDFKNHIIKIVKKYKTNDVIVQGEAIGSFNGNHHNLKMNEIRLFNIFIKGRKLGPAEFFSLCYELGIPHCPFYKRVNLNYSLSEILKESEIKDYLNPKVEVEGLVWRSVKGNLSFKAINNKYLMTEK